MIKAGRGLNKVAAIMKQLPAGKKTPFFSSKTLSHMFNIKKDHFSVLAKNLGLYAHTSCLRVENVSPKSAMAEAKNDLPRPFTETIANERQ